MTNCSAKGKKETRKRKEGNILREWKGSDLCFCRWIMKQHQREEKKRIHRQSKVDYNDWNSPRGFCVIT